MVMVMPFLRKDDTEVSLEEKKTELKNYEESVMHDAQRARQNSTTLQRICEVVQGFKRECDGYQKFAKGSLIDAITKLEGEIKKLDSMVRKVKRAFAIFSGTAGKRKQNAHAIPRDADIKEYLRQGKLSDLRDAKSKLDQFDHDTSVINAEALHVQDNIGLLVTVWNLIGNDVQYVKKQLEYCVKSTCTQIFTPRIKEFETKYKSLYDSLTKYASALSQADIPAEESKSAGAGIPKRGTGIRITVFAAC